MDTESTDLAHAIALGNLSETDSQRLETLRAAGGPAFRAEFDALVRSTRETLAALSTATAVDPPPQLRANVLDLIAAESQSPPTAGATLVDEVGARRRPTQRRATQHWRLVVTAAAAALALIAGGVAIGYNLHRPEPPSIADSILTASDTRTASAQLAVGGSATVVYSRSENTAIVLFDDLVVPPATDVYQMWLIEDGAPRSAGLVDIDPAAATREIIDEIDDARVLAFTVEPSGGSAAPTSEPFAAIEI